MGAHVDAKVASNSSLTTNFVFGIACLSYPLHPPRKTSEFWVSSLLHLGLPALFISGRKDSYCRPNLMDTALNRMANDWKMHWVEGADHELKLRGRVNHELISDMCEWFVQWCQSVFMVERWWTSNKCNLACVAVVVSSKVWIGICTILCLFQASKDTQTCQLHRLMEFSKLPEHVL